MPFDMPISLIFNSFTLALAMGFLLIILWYDIRRSINQYFMIFLLAILIWNIGYLLLQIAQLTETDHILRSIAFSFSLAGFVGSSIGLYALLMKIAGIQPPQLPLFLGLYLFLIGGYTVLILQNTSRDVTLFSLQSQSFAIVFVGLFDSFGLYFSWRYRRKLNNATLMMGTVVFVIGQFLAFANPELNLTAISATISSIGALLISFSIIQREIITPLLDRGAQLESMHQVNIAITTRFGTDSVFNEIVARAADWLSADAAGIFLKQDNMLTLAAIHQLPPPTLNTQLPVGLGMAGVAAASKQTIALENYGRDWKGTEDLPLAKETFGSVICVPLIYDENVIGVLMVIASIRGTLFDRDKVDLLELLASQAAVSLTNDQLFNEQRILTGQIAIANEQLMAVLRSTDSPVLAVNRQMKIIFMNPATKQLLQLEQTITHRNMLDVVPISAQPPNWKQAFYRLKKDGTYHYEINFDAKTYSCHVSVLGDHRMDGFVAVLNDITELKELDRMKSEMVRMTSHDLKNPLQAAMANLELLQEDLVDTADPDVHLSISVIERQLFRMNRIINGILDLERVRMGIEHYTNCHPLVIIERVIHDLENMASEHDITLQTQAATDLPEFMADARQFEQAIINLVENAIKFNKPGGKVILQAILQNDHILFTIADTGIGMPQEAQTKIFDRFYRAQQSGATHITGSGLGLSLVKTVIENHNGKIWVQSTVNEGTTFFIKIPVQKHPVNQPS